MTKAEIAMQLTIAMLDKKLPYNANSNAEMGAAIAEIYNAIYKSICPQPGALVLQLVQNMNEDVDFADRVLERSSAHTVLCQQLHLLAQGGFRCGFQRLFLHASHPLPIDISYPR